MAPDAALSAQPTYAFNDDVEETINDARRRCGRGRHILDNTGRCIECQARP